MRSEDLAILEQLRQHIDTGNLVLFVGNGVRRLPTYISPDETGSPASEKADLGPSWQSYMESLWELAQDREDNAAPKAFRKRDDNLDFRAFSRLTAPRQAEWFDRRADVLLGESSGLASKFRMHRLGLDLHPRPGIPTNPLLALLAEITLDCASNRGPAGVDLITTNVDCAIEQNIARATDRTRPDAAPRLIVRTAQGHTATWLRTGASSGQEIRIWKIHGCLSALKTNLQKTWPKTRKRLAHAFPAEQGQLYELAGAVPTVELWPGSQWRNDVTYYSRKVPSVFSMTEYVSLLHKLLARRPRDLYELFKNRPILFVGYDLHEVDVDVIVTLHRSKNINSPRYALRFRAGAESSSHEEERLRQMGVKWWPFQLGPLAVARLPGELRLTMRHEWRYGDKRRATDRELRADLENPWRRQLQNIASREWLEAQESSLRALGAAASTSRASVPESYETGPRLVIAGLASMWHAFALKKPADMPSRRRVSANLAAVDSEVPGGSGLVPAMVAAAAAGPDHVGQITFLTNVTREWSQWEEIEEFCLGGGIDIQPLQGNLGKDAGARTSHVLLYDPEKQENESWRPRQRMIMDVDELINPGRGGSIARATAPKVRRVPGLGSTDHLLFADKLVSSEVLENWQGPIVFETGSSGDELLDQTVAPTFWTAGFGSFIRTLVCARLGCKSSEGLWQAKLPQDMEEAIAQLRGESELSVLVDQRAPGRPAGEYVALINSFGRNLWTERGGVTHSQELDYGKWVQKQWHELGDILWQIVDQPSTGRPLVSLRGPIGRGILTTLHEAGLMAHLELPDHGKRSAVVRIEAEEDETTLRFVCDVHGAPGTPQVSGPVLLKLAAAREDGSETTGTVIIPGADPVEVPLAERLRRHTLGAGDTVRGCLAYGLWAWAFEKNSRRRPGALEHVLLASCFLASLKSYAGSFVEFLRVVDRLRGTGAWKNLWGFAD